jgi:hypothetical protein
MLRRLGVPEESMPEPRDKGAILKAMLDGIGESAEKFDAVLPDTDITKADLLSAGGRNNGTAFWLIDAIASYQSEKVRARHPFQVWKLIVTEAEGQSRCARLICTNRNNEKPIVAQQIEYTDFLLNEIQLYASVEPVDETGKRKRVIILLPSEY